MEGPTPAMDLEASPIQGQISSAVLDLAGETVKGKLADGDTALLFQILVEAGSMNLNTFRRLTVTLSATKYVVSRDENHVYIVQTTAG